MKSLTWCIVAYVAQFYKTNVFLSVIFPAVFFPAMAFKQALKSCGLIGNIYKHVLNCLLNNFM